MHYKAIKLFLRIAISASFLSAVADRFGMWSKDVAVWGNWDNFLAYTALLNPWFPAATIPLIGISATTAEVAFAVCILVGFKTAFFAKWSGYLLFIFALAMTFSTGIKGALDFSVFSVSAGAFALSQMKGTYLELDSLFPK